MKPIHILGAIGVLGILAMGAWFMYMQQAPLPAAGAKDSAATGQRGLPLPTGTSPKVAPKPAPEAPKAPAVDPATAPAAPAAPAVPEGKAPAVPEGTPAAAPADEAPDPQ